MSHLRDYRMVGLSPNSGDAEHDVAWYYEHVS